MSSKAAEAIKKIANQNDVKLHACKVDAVSGSTCDVTPISGDAPFKQVRLNADINSDNGIVITPVIGSVVLLCEINKLDSYVSMFSEIESISFKIGNTTALYKNGEIIFNEGDNNGLVKVQDMVSWMNKVYTDFQTLITLLAAIPVAPVGPALVGSVTFVPQTPVPVIDDFINPKVKH